MIFSSVLAIGDKSDIGLYDDPSLGFFCGFNIGTILASFQICGIMFLLRAMLYVSFRYSRAIGPRCFKCFIFMLSGPVELLFLLSFIASLICIVVTLISGESY